MKRVKREKRIIKRVFMDLYCTRCSLQFDKRLTINMHLISVHKERVNIKEESTIIISKSNPNGTRTMAPNKFKCEFCNYSCARIDSMATHVL